VNIDNLNQVTLDSVTGKDAWKLRATLRAVFRRSLYVLCKSGICYNEPLNLMDADTYKESCDWLQWVVTTKKRGLFEDPRGHIKTTRCTRGIPPWYAIQVPQEEHDFEAEIDRAQEFLAKHPHMRGPDGRLVIGSDSKERAAAWVSSTKSEWETNTILRWTFPELLWENTNRVPYGSWKATAYTLNGRKNPTLSDPFMTAVGIDSKTQGGRAEGLILDDLVGETSYRSPTELQRRCDWARTIGFILENRDYQHIQGGFVIVNENRWALDDVNSMIHNEMKDWAIWHRAAYRCIVHGAGNCGRWSDDTERTCANSDEPLWKGRYPDADSLERVRLDVGSEQFAAQFLNDPTAAAELHEDSLRVFRLQVATTKINNIPVRDWCVIIPAVGPDNKPIQGADDEIIPLQVLQSHIISIDPASSKDSKNARTCISWFAFDKPTGRVFWLDCFGDHMEAATATRAAFKIYKEAAQKLSASPNILIEKVACQSYFGAAMKFLAVNDGVRLPEPEMIPPAHGVAKDDRIRRRVGNRLNQGLLYLRSGLQLPRSEIKHFPTGSKDSLDTLVQAEEKYLELIGSPRGDRLQEVRRRKRQRRLQSTTSAGVSI
jgi:hypothetical protein